MADILIRGMDMPKNCYDCVLNFSFFWNLRCNELEGMSGFVGSRRHANDRHPDCPLVPLPEGHGRLGDLDALAYSDEVKRKGCAYQEEIFRFPTIVPAEGGNEDGDE